VDEWPVKPWKSRRVCCGNRVVHQFEIFFAQSLASPERGWNRSRWAVASVTLGPLAIPLIYLVDAAYAVRKMMSAPRA
jgi:hypothetical protein